MARIRGRLVLRDGYHRSFGLLSRRITHVPAYVRDYDTTENLAPAGMLPQNKNSASSVLIGSAAAAAAVTGVVMMVLPR